MLPDVLLQKPCKVALPLAMIVTIATQMLMVAPGRVALRRRLPIRHRRHGVRRM
jgi:hypothetical protein